jgi:hypothetical protein
VRQIPAGGEGKITLKFNTNGYGGRRVRESARIKTNDPTRPWLDIAVTGLVENFVDITPPRLSLRGPVGAPLKATVIITPKDKHPFKITGSRARQGKYFKFELTEQSRDGKLQYLLTVETMRQAKGRYADVIDLDTDSRIKPRIQVPVLVYLFERKKSQTE